MDITNFVLLYFMADTCILLGKNVVVNSEGIDDIANNISKGIKEYTKKITRYQDIKNEFIKLNNSKKLKIRKVDGSKVVKDFKSDIEALFLEKTNALKKIRKKVIKAKANQSEVKDNKLQYLNMREIEGNVSIEIDEGFSSKVPVNMSASFVQIPTNIFAYKPEILKTVKWTEELDDTFRDNFKESNKSMLFQFYGDRSGLFRVYPGTILGLEDKQKADFFDVRRRVWYLQATASPKDVVIMVDVSGSMVGSNIGIARITATSLIDTLGENDFFNVITVKYKVQYMRHCMQYLIQATKHNKEMMKLALQNVGEVNKTIDADVGIREAFTILNSSHALNRSSASCNRAIMFISDGIESDYVGRKIFQELNANLSVRAFTFLIGQKRKDIKREGLLNMACKNRGYFYGIETIGNVWETVLHYMTVMSRPMNINNAEGTPMYSPIYMDATGQGMVMTVSMGIFDDEGVIGVAGTDIDIKSILSKIPYWNFGTYSHMIMIDNNGFAIIHPKLREQQGYLPSHRNVFIEDLEYAVDIKNFLQIKKKMIDRVPNGEVDLAIYWSYSSNTKLVQLDAKIYYTPIDKSEFTVAFVTPKKDASFFDYDSLPGKDEWLDKGIDALNQSKANVVVKIADWLYCKKANDGSSPRSVEAYYTASELMELIERNNRSINKLPCNEMVLRRLLVTAGVVNDYVKEQVDDKAINNLFVATSGGYLKKISISDDSPYVPSFQKVPYFEYAASNLNEITISTPRNRMENSTSSKVITVTAAIRLNNELHSVVGFELFHNQFEMIFFEASKRLKNGSSIAFLLDRNGLIVYSNEESSGIGRFIGELNLSLLVEKLENNSIFKKVELHNTQAECEANKINKCMHSASNFLLTPIKTIFKGISILFNSISWIIIQYSTLLVSPVSSSESGHKEEPVPNVTCTEKMTFYLVQDRYLETLNKDNKQIKCSSNCEMRYDMKPVKDTNLFLLIINMKSECRHRCMKSSTKLGPVRIEEITDRPQRYRRRPSSCHNDIIKNETLGLPYMCGRGNNLKPHVWILFLIVFTCLKVCYVF